MNLATIIAQLKTYAPQLNGQVSGAADFASGLESVVNLPLPAAFVMPIEDDVGDNTDRPGLWQTVDERIAVVVQFDNTTGSDADRRTGFAGANQVYDMRAALWSALLAWVPPDQMGRVSPPGFTYGGGRLVDFDRARLFWQFEFVLPAVITDADGFPLRGDTPITVHGTLTVPGNPGNGPEIIFDIPKT